MAGARIGFGAFIFTSSVLASAEATFTYSAEPVTLIGKFGTPSRACQSACLKLRDEGKWYGPEHGQILYELVVVWRDDNTSVTIPQKYLCGLYDTPSKTTNPLGLEVHTSASPDCVVVSNLLIGGEFTLRANWVVSKGGDVDFFVLPDNCSMVPVPESEGIYVRQ